MSSPRENDVLAIDELTKICSVNGRTWWQQRKRAKSHAQSTTDESTPLTGDLLIEPVDEVTLAYVLKRFGDDDVMVSRPYYLDVINETHNTDRKRMVLRNTHDAHFREL